MTRLPEAFNVIQNRKQFVAWTLTKEGKKMPINPHTGKAAKADDVSTWGDLGKAQSINGNIGIELGFGIGGIDIDDCFSDDGTLSDMANDIVKTLDSYVEYSPSGTGLHILFLYERMLDFGNGKEGRRDSTIGLELYLGRHFLTITGKPFGEEKPIAERTAEMTVIYEKYLKKDTQQQQHVDTKKHEPKPVIEPKHYDNSRLLSAMFNSKEGAKIQRLFNGDIAGYESQSEADLALMNYAAFWCRCDTSRMLSLFSESKLAQRAKWNRNDYREGLIGEAVAGINRKRRDVLNKYMTADTAYNNTFLSKAFDGRIPARGQFEIVYKQNDIPNVRFYPLKEKNGFLLMPMSDPFTGEFLSLVTFAPTGESKPAEGLYVAGAFTIHSRETQNAFLTCDLLSALAIADDTDGEADVYCVYSWGNCCSVATSIRSLYKKITLVSDSSEASRKNASWCLKQSVIDKTIAPHSNAETWYKFYKIERS